MDRPIVTLAEARVEGLKHYYTGKPCSRGHVAERLTSNWTCCECDKLRGPTAERKAYKAAYNQTDKRKAYERSEGRREDSRRHARKSHAAHPHKKAAFDVAKRSPAALIPLTEVEQAQVRWFYVAARELAKRTGREYHVDHCYPLSRGGLHHPLNLMVLPAWVNRKKQSDYQPDNPLVIRGMQLKDRLSLRISIPS